MEYAALFRVVGVFFVVVVAAAVVCVVVLSVRRPGWLQGILSAKRGGDREGESLGYVSRGYLLSKGEAAFYRSMCKAVGDKYTIAMKVRLADVLKCAPGPGRAGAFNRIAGKHLDFVLLDRQLRMVLAVELDDRSHRRVDRQRRDAFVDGAMESAGVPLLRQKAQASYDDREIGAAIVGALGRELAGRGGGS